MGGGRHQRAACEAGKGGRWGAWGTMSALVPLSTFLGSFKNSFGW